MKIRSILAAGAMALTVLGGTGVTAAGASTAKSAATFNPYGGMQDATCSSFGCSWSEAGMNEYWKRDGQHIWYNGMNCFTSMAWVAKYVFGVTETFSACGYNGSGTGTLMFGYDVTICAQRSVPIDDIQIPVEGCAKYVVRRYVYANGVIGGLTVSVWVWSPGGWWVQVR